MSLHALSNALERLLNLLIDDEQDDLDEEDEPNSAYLLELKAIKRQAQQAGQE